MKALIKYLPVKGEIKEGVKVWWEDPDNSEASQFYIVQEIVPDVCVHLSNEYSECEAYLSELSIIKPFVVTQDIKVGDRIYFNECKFEGILQECNEGGYEVMEGNVGYDFVFGHDIGYKILGEVSSKATFVEDGKEYDVKEIKVQDTLLIENKKDTKPTLYPSFHVVYKVKCPCCGDFK